MPANLEMLRDLSEEGLGGLSVHMEEFFAHKEVFS